MSLRSVECCHRPISRHAGVRPKIGSARAQVGQSCRCAHPARPGESSPMPPHSSLLDPDSAAQHRSRLLAVARSLCGSTQLAEDLTQETYARVLAKPRDRKSTRLNSSHPSISYAVFCLKKKKSEP